MQEWKGHVLHLRALGLLKDMPGWVCWQAGGGQRPEEIRYLEELKKLAAQTGIADRVRFLGQRQDVTRLMAAADIYCQPNTGPEPFGIAFIEALASGLSVVTTSMGGATEIIDDDSGILVPPADPRALSESLRRLIKEGSLRDRFREAGPKRARELCDPLTQLRRLYDLFASIAGREAAA
jgi:glycosyltransferase involved in cell wall biosynthesis